MMAPCWLGEELAAGYLFWDNDALASWQKRDAREMGSIVFLLCVREEEK